MKKTVILLVLFLSISLVYAKEAPFIEGEVLNYDIHFKWGLVMMKAGAANYTVKKGSFENNTTYKTSLDFKTTTFFDGIFKIRDTLVSHIDAYDLKPLYNIRKINEGKTRFWEETFVKTHSPDFTKVRVKRQNDAGIKFDTTMVANNAGYDMLSVFTFARTLDYSQLTQDQTMHISSFVGRDKVNITVHFKGQAIVEKSESVKYKAYLLAIDIGDDAFKESKTAMEIWVSDDKNHIPLKIKAKLRIGAAEVNLAAWKNLKYPLSSEITIPAR